MFRRMVLKDLQDLKVKKINDPGDIKNGIKKLGEERCCGKTSRQRRSHSDSIEERLSRRIESTTKG